MRKKNWKLDEKLGLFFKIERYRKSTYVIKKKVRYKHFRVSMSEIKNIAPKEVQNSI